MVVFNISLHIILLKLIAPITLSASGDLVACTFGSIFLCSDLLFAALIHHYRNLFTEIRQGVTRLPTSDQSEFMILIENDMASELILKTSLEIPNSIFIVLPSLVI